VCVSVCLECKCIASNNNKKAVLSQGTTARCGTLVQKTRTYIILGKRSE